MITKYQPIIEVIEENYEIPHLGATRKISALLPHDYYEYERDCAVLYLQDGQNLFNPNAPFGDWAIDQSLERLARQSMKNIIIIAIDHGEEERIVEYLPFKTERFGQGKGQHYISFMKDKLIPYVQKKYRVKKGYEHTGIGGSSMGGLISLYAGLTNPDVFGKMMIFSPSLWIDNQIYKLARKFNPRPETRMYLYAGGKESREHLPNVKKLEKILRKKEVYNPEFGFDLSVNMFGSHAEMYWSLEFPRAVEWLFFAK